MRRPSTGIRASVDGWPPVSSRPRAQRIEASVLVHVPVSGSPQQIGGKHPMAGAAARSTIWKPRIPLIRTEPQMSKPIIVGVAPQRDNDSSLRLATGMSRITGAPIVAIASLPHETQGTRIGADLRADAAPTLAALAGGLDAELEVITGASPARALNNAAIARDAGMIVVGPTQLAWVGGLRPGTTAEQLLPSSACAVAIAPKRLNDEWTPRRVGVGFIDLEEGYEALRAAVALAGAAAASLHVVTAP